MDFNEMLKLKEKAKKFDELEKLLEFNIDNYDVIESDQYDTGFADACNEIYDLFFNNQVSDRGCDMIDETQTYEKLFIEHPYIMRYFSSYIATTYYFKIRDVGVYKVVKLNNGDVYHIYKVMSSGVPEFIQNVQTPKDVIEFVNKL